MQRIDIKRSKYHMELLSIAFHLNQINLLFEQSIEGNTDCNMLNDICDNYPFTLSFDEALYQFYDFLEEVERPIHFGEYVKANSIKELYEIFFNSISSIISFLLFIDDNEESKQNFETIAKETEFFNCEGKTIEHYIVELKRWKNAVRKNYEEKGI